MNVRNALCIVLFAVYILVIFGSGALEIYYSYHLPGSPNVATGHIYRMTVNHGFVVYGTKIELQLYDTDQEMFPISFAIIIIVLLIRSPWKNVPQSLKWYRYVNSIRQWRP